MIQVFLQILDKTNNNQQIIYHFKQHIFIQFYQVLKMDIDKWIEIVQKGNILPENCIKKLCRKVKTLLFEQSNVQPVQAPVTVCGDVHGQFHDVIQMFQKSGKLPNTRYIMIGDFVDRGFHSVQTITLLFLYKAKYPNLITLLRGNHQSRNVSRQYGFYEQIQKKYGCTNVWNIFNDAFDYLPLAAIIQGKIFCVHGGITPFMIKIDHFRSIDRVAQIPIYGPFCDLMWSDPSQDIDKWSANSRGVGWVFGKQALLKFLQVNNIQLVTRAHQLCMQGYSKQFDQKLITVWSAPNYCYRMGNKASFMQVKLDLVPRFTVFQASKKNTKQHNYKLLIPYFL